MTEPRPHLRADGAKTNEPASVGTAANTLPLTGAARTVLEQAAQFPANDRENIFTAFTMFEVDRFMRLPDQPDSVWKSVAAGAWDYISTADILTVASQVESKSRAGAIPPGHVLAALILTAQLPWADRSQLAAAALAVFDNIHLDDPQVLPNPGPSYQLPAGQLHDPHAGAELRAVHITDDPAIPRRRVLHLLIRVVLVLGFAAACYVRFGVSPWTPLMLPLGAAILWHPARPDLSSRRIDLIAPALSFSGRIPLHVAGGSIAFLLGGELLCVWFFTAWAVLESVDRWVIKRECLDTVRFQSNPCHPAVNRMGALHIGGRHLWMTREWDIVMVAITPLLLINASLPYLVFTATIITRRRWSAALVAATIVTAILLGGRLDVTAAVVAVVAAALGILVRQARSNQSRRPVPFTFNPLLMLSAPRVWPAAHALRKDRPLVAIHLLEGRVRTYPSPAIALLAWAFAESGDLQSAKTLLATIPETAQDTTTGVVRVSIAAQLGDRDGYRKARNAPAIQRRSGTGHRAVLAAADAEAALRFRADTITQPIDELVELIWRCASRRQLRAVSIFTRALCRQLDEVTARDVTYELHRLIEELTDTVELEYGSAIVTPADALEYLRTYIDLIRYRHPNYLDAAQAVEPVSAQLLTWGLDVEAGEAWLTAGNCATEITGQTDTRYAVRARLNGLAALNLVRHQLLDAADRRSWYQRLTSVLDQCCNDAVARQDWRRLAELIETGRLQADAIAAPTAKTDTPGTSPTPVVVSIDGRSTLSESVPALQRRRTISLDLDTGRQWIGGDQAYWLGLRTTSVHVFWALLTPEGTAVGGRLPAGPGSPLADALAAYRQLSTVQHPDEDFTSYISRRAVAPLTSTEPLERTVAADLGAALIPPILADLLGAQKVGILAIAFDAPLAHVPWAALSLGGQRLIELTEITAAVPVRLAASIATRATPDRPSAFLTTVTAPASVLQGAAQLAALISDERHNGECAPHHHVAAAGTPRGGTNDVLAEALARLERAARHPRDGDAPAALLASHGLPDTEGANGTGGLLLYTDPPAESIPDKHGRTTYIHSSVLSATALLSAGTKVPTHVVVLACDSSGLRADRYNEWMTLGPALLWAGAERVIATSAPIDDASGLDAHLVDHLRSAPLLQALRRWQLDALERWRGGDPNANPSNWAGHTAMGIFAGGATPGTTLAAPASTQANPGHSAAVSLGSSFGALLNDPDRILRRRLTISNLTWTTFFEVADRVRTPRRPLLQLWTYAWVLPRLALNRILPRAHEPWTATPQVLDALRQAAHLAKLHGRTHASVADIFLTLLSRRTPFAALLRLATGWADPTTRIRDFDDAHDTQPWLPRPEQAALAAALAGPPKT